MAIWNFVLLVVELWIMGSVVFTLHAISPRFGISLLLMFTATITAILVYADPATLFIEALPGIILTIPADVFIPIILLVILLLYIVDGTDITQIVIAGIALIQVVVGIVFAIATVHSFMPGTTALVEGAVFTDMLSTNARILIASVVAFIVDMLAVAIIYQGAQNNFRHGRWLAAPLALIGALWVDSIVFNLLSSIGVGGFVAFLPGDIISKTLAGLVLSPLVVVYLMRLVPKMPGMTMAEQRPTFDIIHNVFGNLRQRVATLEIELRESDVNFRQLVSHVPEIMWIAEHGDDGAYFVSPAIEGILGIKRGEYYIDPDMTNEMIHPDDRATVNGRWLTPTLETRTMEFRVICRDGTTRWLRDNAYSIHDEKLNVNRTIGITEDVTLRKAQQELQTSIQVEQEKAKLLQGLLQDMAHDVKQPLGSMTLKADLMNMVDDTQRRKRYAEELRQQTHHLTRMLDHMFTMLRLESGETLEKNTVALRELLDDALLPMQTVAESKGVNLNMALEIPPTITINCQYGEISRAVSNLVSNAIRYTPQGGTVKVRAYYDERWIYIRVRDTGIGIPPEDLPHIFERFYRGSNVKGSISGSGLGLAITKRVIEDHNGTLTVESVPDEGTTFLVTLPITQEGTPDT